MWRIGLLSFATSDPASAARWKAFREQLRELGHVEGQSDGHDTLLTEIPDIARANVWPGAMARSRRNASIERWAGREWELRAREPDAVAALEGGRETGHVDNASLFIGQDAGLIHDIPAAGKIVERIVAEAEALLRRLPPSEGSHGVLTALAWSWRARC